MVLYDSLIALTAQRNPSLRYNWVTIATRRTSYRPISLLSVIAKTLEKCLLPSPTTYLTEHHNMDTKHNTPQQQPYSSQIA